jgi:hypothetical protein
MMSALGWQGMRNKRLTILALLLAAATVVFAQENDPSETASNPVTPVEAPFDAEAVTEERTVTATSPESNNAAVASAGSEANESLTATDDYRATERISEDRSVSFPVDI